MLVIQLGSYLLAHNGINNLFLSHFYFGLQYVFLSFFFLSILTNDFQKKVVKFMLAFCLILFSIQYTIKPELFFKFNMLEIFVTSILVIIYATFHLYNLLNERKKYYFITIGILIYLFGSTSVFLVGNLSILLSTKYEFASVWYLNVYLYVIYQLIIMYEWKVSFYKPKPLQVYE